MPFPDELKTNLDAAATSFAGKRITYDKDAAVVTSTEKIFFYQEVAAAIQEGLPELRLRVESIQRDSQQRREAITSSEEALQLLGKLQEEVSHDEELVEQLKAHGITQKELDAFVNPKAAENTALLEKFSQALMALQSETATPLADRITVIDTEEQRLRETSRLAEAFSFNDFLDYYLPEADQEFHRLHHGFSSDSLKTQVSLFVDTKGLLEKILAGYPEANRPKTMAQWTQFVDNHKAEINDNIWAEYQKEFAVHLEQLKQHDANLAAAFRVAQILFPDLELVEQRLDNLRQNFGDPAEVISLMKEAVLIYLGNVYSTLNLNCPVNKSSKTDEIVKAIAELPTSMSLRSVFGRIDKEVANFKNDGWAMDESDLRYRIEVHLDQLTPPSSTMKSFFWDTVSSRFLGYLTTRYGKRDEERIGFFRSELKYYRVTLEEQLEIVHDSSQTIQKQEAPFKNLAHDHLLPLLGTVGKSEMIRALVSSADVELAPLKIVDLFKEFAEDH